MNDTYCESEPEVFMKSVGSCTLSPRLVDEHAAWIMCARASATSKSAKERLPQTPVMVKAAPRPIRRLEDMDNMDAALKSTAAA